MQWRPRSGTEPECAAIQLVRPFIAREGGSSTTIPQGPASSQRIVRRCFSCSASVVLGAFLNPCANGVPVACREFLLSVWHARFGGSPPVQQPHQVATCRISRKD